MAQRSRIAEAGLLRRAADGLVEGEGFGDGERGGHGMCSISSNLRMSFSDSGAAPVGARGL